MKRAFSSRVGGAMSITGVAELDKQLKLLGNKMERNIVRKAMRRFTAKIKKEAKSLAPVRTGRLKKSIVNKVSLKANGTLTGKVYISKEKYGVSYGHFVEWGREYPPMRTNRFMTLAFEKYNDKTMFASEVESTLDEYLEKMVGRHR